jgi:hypothetical protein
MIECRHRVAHGVRAGCGRERPAQIDCRRAVNIKFTPRTSPDTNELLSPFTMAHLHSPIHSGRYPIRSGEKAPFLLNVIDSVHCSRTWHNSVKHYCSPDPSVDATGAYHPTGASGCALTMLVRLSARARPYRRVLTSCRWSCVGILRNRGV